MLERQSKTGLTEALIFKHLASTLIPPVAGVRLPPSQNPIPDSLLASLPQKIGMRPILPALLLWQQTGTGFANILALDVKNAAMYRHDIPQRMNSNTDRKANDSQYSSVLSVADTISAWVTNGRKLQNAAEVVLESHYSKMNRKKIGDNIVIAGKDFRIVGTYKKRGALACTAPDILFSLQDAQQLLPPQTTGTNGVFAAIAPEQLPVLRDDLKAMGLSVMNNDPAGQIFGGFQQIAGWFILAGWLAVLLFSGLVMATTV